MSIKRIGVLTGGGDCSGLNAVVRAVISQEEYVRRKGEVYLNEHYNGSLPKFVAAFMDKKKLKRSEIEELAKMIEAYKGE